MVEVQYDPASDTPTPGQVEPENPHLAPLLSTLKQSGLTFSQLEDNLEGQHYLLKCTDGIFSGKFLFMNTTPDGEVFGSGDPEENQDITMYIESANLSERHADIKFHPTYIKSFVSFASFASSTSDIDSPGVEAPYQRHGSYILKDLNSESGTWVRIPTAFSREQNQRLLNLHKCLDAVTFRVSEHHFIFETDQSMETIDEVAAWLSLHKKEFPALESLLEQNSMRFKRMRQLAEVLDASLFQQLEGDEVISTTLVEQIMSELEFVAELDLVQTGPKLKLNLRFTDGPSKGKTIACDYSKSLIVFGCLQNPTDEQLEKLVGTADCQYVTIAGDRVCENHFQLVYDPILCSLLIKNVCIDCFESCGVYRCLERNEEYVLEPDDAFRIGTLEFQVQRYNTGVVSDIGQREGMEDSYQCLQDLQLHPKIPCSYYAVFDGHGGYQCAQFLRDNLHLCLVKAFLKRKNSSKSDKGVTPGQSYCLLDAGSMADALAASISEAFHEADSLYRSRYGELAKQCGSTAVVCLIMGQKLICANLGDARAVLCRDSSFVELSQDYKASRKDEQDRIKSQGGYIVFGRVLGRLAVTRAFGDFECKQIAVKNEETGEKELRNFVLCEPEVRVTTIDRQKDDFIILASDGLYDRFSSEDCINLARQKFLHADLMDQDPFEVARYLVSESVGARVNSDNTTAVIVALNSGVEETQETPVQSETQKIQGGSISPPVENDPFGGFVERNI